MESSIPWLLIDVTTLLKVSALMFARVTGAAILKSKGWETLQ